VRLSNERGKENCDFQPINCRISETVQDEAKVTFAVKLLQVHVIV